MRIYTILTSILLLFALHANSQNVYPIKYDNCNDSNFFLEGKEICSNYDDEQLLQDILQDIDSEVMNKIKGEVYFQVVVDTLGNHCCVSMKNDLNGKGKKVDFKKIMDQQTIWGAPIRKGKKANVSAMVKLEFKKTLITLNRLGFNGKTGWVELSKFQMGKDLL